MNVDVIKQSLIQFERRHSVAFSHMSSRQSSILELGAIVGVQEHYRSNGFQIRVENPHQAGRFFVKLSSRGDPWKYSRIIVTKGKITAELHMNLVVEGAHDKGRYCVDVGIVNPNRVPRKKPQLKWTCLPNNRLISFVEVKRLVIYPMLLAQFIGEVHEIAPQFLGCRKVYRCDRYRHLPATLIALGHFSANSSEIKESFHKRGYQVHIAENFDVRVSLARVRSTRSPLYWDHEKY